MKLSNEKLELQIAYSKKKLKYICKDAGIDESTLRKIRKGQRNPTLGMIGKIADGIGCDVVDIIEGEGD